MTDDLSSETSVPQARINAWWYAYDKALLEAAANPEITLDDLIELCWQKGLLDHVSPEDRGLREIRRDLNRTLWPARDNPVLYLRLLYSLVGLYESMHASLKDAGPDGPNAPTLIKLIACINRLPEATKQRFFPETKLHPACIWQKEACKRLIVRAQKAVHEFGGVPHEPILQSDANVILFGIPCRIDQVLTDGTFYLRGHDEESHRKIEQELENASCLGSRGFCPSLVDQENSKNTEGTR